MVKYHPMKEIIYSDILLSDIISIFHLDQNTSGTEKLNRIFRKIIIVIKLIFSGNTEYSRTFVLPKMEYSNLLQVNVRKFSKFKSNGENFGYSIWMKKINSSNTSENQLLNKIHNKAVLTFCPRNFIENLTIRLE